MIRIKDPHPDPYRDIGKTCLDGGMHCPSASSLKCSGEMNGRKLVAKASEELSPCIAL